MFEYFQFRTVARYEREFRVGTGGKLVRGLLVNSGHMRSNNCQWMLFPNFSRS
jgi:hypothetical protein